jgi:hypothetical protein
MNCQEFWNGGSLDHLKECGACAARFARQQHVAAGLSALGAQMRRVEAPARVEQRLVAAFRGQAELGGIRPRGAWWLVGAWAAALAASTALAVMLVRPNQPEGTRRITRSVTQLAMVESPGEFSTGSIADTQENDFLPLPNAERLEPNEEVNLVRMELPRSSMIALGFTVSEERASEPVEADVMLDADGVARAVRFLNRDKSF